MTKLENLMDSILEANNGQVSDECNEDVSFNCNSPLGSILEYQSMYHAHKALADNGQGGLISADPNDSDPFIALLSPIPKNEPEVTFTLEQVKALLGANISIPDSTPPEEEEESYQEPEKEKDPTIDDFYATVEDSLPEGMHIIDSYQNWILMCYKKTYLVPPMKSLSTHQEVVRTSNELKEEVLFKTFVIQFGENTEEDAPLIAKLKNQGIEVLRPYRLSYIKRMLMEV